MVGPVVVGEDSFGDLCAYRHDRIEGGHGFLEDHGDVAAAVVSHGCFGEVEEGLSCKGNVSSDLGGGREEAEEGEGGGGFAGAGFSDEAEGLSGVDLKGDVLDSVVGSEADGQVFYLEKGWVESGEFG